MLEPKRLQEKAIVTSIKNDTATIVTQKQLACKSCASSEICGNGIIEKYFSGKVFTSEVFNASNAKPGDEVIIEASINAITKASLMTYFLPLAVMVLFVLLSDSYFAELILSSPFFNDDKIPADSVNSDLKQIATILFAFVGLIFGFLFTKYYNCQTKNLEQYQFRMVKISNSKISDSVSASTST